ncbi:MAG: hypothetical protein ACSHXI_08935 [Hoeflea sp.]|uniref:hypothetical protein n=1 Tax=Hoeflea sp. TaxID=1940281 RepID=UPI003EF51BB9
MLIVLVAPGFNYRRELADLSMDRRDGCDALAKRHPSVVTELELQLCFSVERRAKGLGYDDTG